MPDYYVLAEDGRTPVKATLGEWAAWTEAGYRDGGAAWRSVARTDLRRGGPSVSTVFLGLDRSLDGGAPLLFETMVFDCQCGDKHMRRYTTYEQAIAGHDEVCEEVRREH